MDILKENTAVLVLVGICVIAAALYYVFQPAKSAEAADEQHVGSSSVGEVYVISSSVETVKKDGRYYLVAGVEERYTDQALLADLQSSAATKDAVAELCIYMFTSDGRYYCRPQRYLIDAQGKVCTDLGSDMQLQMIDSALISDIYKTALKAAEKKLS